MIGEQREQHDTAILAARTALDLASRQPTEVPEGFVLVPREPTEAMRDDGIWALPPHSAHVDVGEVWSAMIAAATPPAPTVQNA